MSSFFSHREHYLLNLVWHNVTVQHHIPKKWMKNVKIQLTKKSDIFWESCCGSSYNLTQSRAATPARCLTLIASKQTDAQTNGWCGVA